MGVSVVVWGLDTVRTDKEVTTASNATAPPSNVAFTTIAETRNAVLIAIGMAALSLVLSLTITILVSIYTRTMITFLNWAAVVIAIGATVAGIYFHSVYIAIFSGLSAVVFALYALGIELDIDFAVGNIRIATAAIGKHWSMFIVAVVATIMQTIWVLLCLLVILGVAKNSRPDPSTIPANLKAYGEVCKDRSECASNACRYRAGDIMWISKKHCVATFPGFEHLSSANYVEYFFLLVSLYWGLQVLRYIPNTTAASTVAAFWYDSESHFTTGATLARSLTTSFGSICFGALLGATCDALRLLAAQSRSEGSVLGYLAECVLGCFGDFFQNINHWAYVYVAMYGYKLTDAGKAALELFSQRQFLEIVQDDFVYLVLSIAAVGIGLICGGIGALLARREEGRE